MSDTFEPVEVEGPSSPDKADLYGDYRHLFPILIEDRVRLVPEDNSVLRALQYLEVEEGLVCMDWGRYCWNNTTGCCEMTYRTDADPSPRSGRACQVQVECGLRIDVLPPGGRVTDRTDPEPEDSEETVTP